MLLIIPALNVVGALIKKCPFVPNWMIPMLLVAAGAFSYAGIQGFTFENILTGVGYAGVAIGIYDTIKEGVKK